MQTGCVGRKHIEVSKIMLRFLVQTMQQRLLINPGRWGSKREEVISDKQMEKAEIFLPPPEAHTVGIGLGQDSLLDD